MARGAGALRKSLRSYAAGPSSYVSSRECVRFVFSKREDVHLPAASQICDIRRQRDFRKAYVDALDQAIPVIDRDPAKKETRSFDRVSCVVIDVLISLFQRWHRCPRGRGEYQGHQGDQSRVRRRSRAGPESGWPYRETGDRRRSR